MLVDSLKIPLGCLRFRMSSSPKKWVEGKSLVRGRVTSESLDGGFEGKSLLRYRTIPITPFVLSYVSSKIILLSSLTFTLVTVKCTIRTKCHFVSSHVLIIRCSQSNLLLHVGESKVSNWSEGESLASFWVVEKAPILW